jgi:hypothetical protein
LEISHYVFILSNQFYIKISEISKPCGKYVYEKQSPFPEVKAADCLFFITFQTFWVNYADNHFLGNLFSCADNLYIFMDKKI